MEPTIYKPSIYKGAGIYKNGGGGGGGGGSENPDGSIKKFALLNKNTSHFLEIPGTFQTKYKYNFSCLGWSGGLFGLIIPGSQAYYYRTLLGFRGTDSTAEGRTGLSGNYSVSGYSIGAVNEYKITDNGRLIFSLNSNGVEVFSDDKEGLGNATSQTLNIFRCYDGQDCGIGSFLSFEIKDENDEEIIYKFTPAEKEGVAGVYEEVTNTFYGETYHDNTIVCI